MTTEAIDPTRMKRLLAAPIDQQAAAMLLGVSARSVRDYLDLPRNHDGTYTLGAVIDFGRRRIKLAPLEGDDAEYVRQVGEEVALYPGAVSVLEALQRIDGQHGDAGLLAFVRTFASAMRQHCGEWPTLPTPVPFRRVTCEGCGAVRVGPAWMKPERVPDRGRPIDHAVCPTCEEIQPAERGGRSKSRRRGERRVEVDLGLA